MQRIFTLASAVFILAAHVSITGCSPSTADNPAAPPYYHLASAQALKQEPSYTIEREFPGMVSARQSADLGFELAGKLARLTVDEGDTVAAGAVLAELDSELLTISTQEIDAQIGEIDAQLALVAANLKRVSQLDKKGFAAAQNLDELRYEQQALQATRTRLKAMRAANSAQIRKSTLIAPFAGRISRRYADVGAVVSAGTPVLRLLETAGSEVRIGVPVRVQDTLTVGATLSVRVGDSIYPAQVLAIGPDVDAATRTLPVRLALPADAGLLAGELAYLRLPETLPEAGFWVPLAALSDGLRGLWQVYALRPDGDGLYRVERRDVRVAHTTADRVFVSGALADGELLLAAGTHRYAPGQVVRLEALP